MRGLRHARRWRRDSSARAWGSDRGAIAATVAIMLGTGVLIGMSAIVVDVGRLYAEREQLQSGADAAAWAVAEGCVLDPTSCADQAGVAGSYAERNAADAAAAVTVICGSGPGLPGCPLPAGNRTDCLGEAPPTEVAFAEVRTATRLPDDSTLLPPAFAGLLAGGAYEGTEVGACARVAWGPPRRARGLAVTFARCERDFLTGADVGAERLWSHPVALADAPEAEKVVWLKGSPPADYAPACPISDESTGRDAPGAFGWLDDDGTDDCQATVGADTPYLTQPGNSDHPCGDALDAVIGAVSLIPVYSTVSGTGNNVEYELDGFVSFVLTGFFLGNNNDSKATSSLTGRTDCSAAAGSSDRCLYGYFTRGLAPGTGQEIGGPDLGVSIINLVG